MRRALLAGLVFVAACNGERESGYVEIKTVAALAPQATALYVNSVKVEPLKKGVAVLKHDVGPARLEIERGGALAKLCDFDIRKNRVVTLNIVGFDRNLRCDVQR